MSITTLAHATTVIDSVVAYGARAYMMASEVFTISAILWCLNFMANLIEKTYKFGKMVGAFYYEFMHEALMKVAYKSLITTIVIVAWLAGFATYVWKNREVYISKLNDIRDIVSEAFTYRNEVLA